MAGDAVNHVVLLAVEVLPLVERCLGRKPIHNRLVEDVDALVVPHQEELREHGHDLPALGRVHATQCRELIVDVQWLGGADDSLEDFALVAKVQQSVGQEPLHLVIVLVRQPIW